MSAEGIDSKRAAVIDRRYSAIFSHLLRAWANLCRHFAALTVSKPTHFLMDARS
jgi:hypothetical protein